MFRIASCARAFEILFAAQRRNGDQPDQRTFQLPHVVLNPSGDEKRHLIRNDDTHRLRFSFQNRNLSFQIGRLDVGDQSPFKSRVESFLESRNFARADNPS